MSDRPYEDTPQRALLDILTHLYSECQYRELANLCDAFIEEIDQLRAERNVARTRAAGAAQAVEDLEKLNRELFGNLQYCQDKLNRLQSNLLWEHLDSLPDLEL